MAKKENFQSQAALFIDTRLAESEAAQEAEQAPAHPQTSNEESSPASPPDGYRYQLVEKRTRRFQFMLAPSDFKAASAKAKKLKISLNEYFNRLVIADLQG